MSFTAHLVAEHRETVQERLAEMMAGACGSFQLEARCMGRSGVLLWALVRAVLEHREDGAPGWIMAMIENITERKRAEQELIRQARLSEHQALHDPLTGLPNRLLFGERIGQAIRQAQRTGTRLASRRSSCGTACAISAARRPRGTSSAGRCPPTSWRAG